VTTELTTKKEVSRTFPTRCLFILFIYLFFAVFGLAIKAYTFTHSIFVKSFVLRYGLPNYLPRLALNCDPSDLCLLSR
jgi:hypothetical protein